MSGVPIHRTPIRPEWIDYNGHVRDAYCDLIASHAIDSLMDRLGIDARYREQTSCTLYTVEMHTHYLREISAHDTVEVSVRILGADHKRIHAALELVCEGSRDTAAACEVMLLHIRQNPTPRTAPFPEKIAEAIAELQRTTAAMPPSGPGSRRIELVGR